ncbi:MAG TPA: hypothetical protein VNT55_17980 [Baekduia sp.]|nr:hypothetical protein [Baekduia sp.]
MTQDRPRLVALELATDPEPWRAAGFAVGDGVCRIGTTDLVLSGGDGGFAGWTLAGAIPEAEGLEGVPTTVTDRPDETVAAPHPNGVCAIDHVVLATPDTTRTFEALEAAGFALRRVRDAGAHRQGFFLFADALLEVVGPPEPGPGPAALWGITLVCDDLDAAAEQFGDGHLGAPRDAVQPGRRIAVADRAAGLGVRVALMSPRG